MFWKKEKNNKDQAPSMPDVYPVGAVSYNGGDEVFCICMACFFALQTYEVSKKLSKSKAKDIEPFAKMWEKIIEKNFGYMEKCLTTGQK